jgi:hypothetical protein
MSPNLGSRWATWGTVSSGFREIEISSDRLESVGRVAPFVAPAVPARQLAFHGDVHLPFKRRAKVSTKADLSSKVSSIPEVVLTRRKKFAARKQSDSNLRDL